MALGEKKRFMGKDSVNMRGVDKVTRDIEKERRRTHLRQQGLSEAKIQALEFDSHLYSIDRVNDTIEGFRERGFSSPLAIARAYPTLFFDVSFPSLDERMQLLTDRGFTKVVRTIEKNPVLLGYSAENIDATLDSLQQRGFKNPVKMAEKFPQIFSPSSENLDTKIEFLRKWGFKDPIKLIEAFPSLFGLSEANIEGKLMGLSQRGFPDPVHLVEKLPTVLGLSFKNIDRRLGLLERFTHTYHLSYTPQEMMEYSTNFFSNKVGKLILLVRVLGHYSINSSELSLNFMHTAVQANIEDLLVAFSEREPGDTVQDLLARANKVKKQGLPVEDKRGKIAHIDDFRIVKRYFKEYPDRLAS